jgi:hypothetical protein
VFTRFKSTTLTGGAGNPVVALLELIVAVATSALAIFLPVLTVVAVLLLLVFFARRVHGLMFGRGAAKRAVGPRGRPRVPRGP